MLCGDWEFININSFLWIKCLPSWPLLFTLTDSLYKPQLLFSLASWCQSSSSNPCSRFEIQYLTSSCSLVFNCHGHDKSCFWRYLFVYSFLCVLKNSEILPNFYYYYCHFVFLPQGWRVYFDWSTVLWRPEAKWHLTTLTWRDLYPPITRWWLRLLLNKRMIKQSQFPLFTVTFLSILFGHFSY